MKQLVVALIAFFAMVGSASAQIDPNGIARSASANLMRDDMISPVVRIVASIDDDTKDDDSKHSGFIRTKHGTDTGSGTIIYSSQRDGSVKTFILTNFHVISGTIPKPNDPATLDRHGEVNVDRFTYSAKGALISTTRMPAHVVAFDKKVDLAVVMLVDDTTKFPTAIITKDDTINVFDQVFAVGSGLGHPTYVTDGIISQTDTEIDGHRFIQSSAPIIMGNSGGALFRFEAASGHYELIGVPAVVQFYNEGAAYPNMGWSIPAETVRDFLKSVNLGFVVGEEPITSFPGTEPPATNFPGIEHP